MIWLTRLFYVFLLSLGIYYVWPYFSVLSFQQVHIMQNENLDRVSHAQKSLTYIITQERWTTFPLNDMDQVIRVVSHANLPSHLQRDDYTWHYAFEYQVVDHQGQVVVQHYYHHRARILQYEDVDKKPSPNKYFYADPTLNPTSGQIMMINLKKQRSIRSIRLRLYQKDEGIKDVNIRLYQPSPIARHKYAFFWKRLHLKQKERLASGNLYPLALLREDEIYHIMANYFSPLGPTGIEGKDYDVRTLYIDQSYEIEKVSDAILPSGLLVFDGFHGTIPMDMAGDVTLSFLPTQSTEHAVNTHIQLHWYGKNRGKRRSFRVPWQGDGIKKTLSLGAGLLEVISSQPLLVRVSRGKEDITPKRNAIRMYQVDRVNHVDFAIEHVNNTPTPFRLALRTMQKVGHKNLRWQVLDQQGAVIQKGVIEVNNMHSHYDRPLHGNDFSSISESTLRYFSIPIRGVRLHLEADSPVLVAGYSRPFQLIRHLRVPQDYEWFVEQEGEQRAWFLVRPLAYSYVLAHGKNQMVRIQTRPPIDHPDLLKGDYAWEDYHPQGLWLARYLLLKRDKTKLVRPEAISSVFRVIPINRDMTLFFKSSVGRTQVTPTLIILNRDKEQGVVDIIWDGKKMDTHLLQESQTVFHLPSVTSGKHSLKVDSSSRIRVMVNHTGVGSQGYTKRLSNRFDRKTLVFNYHKSTSQKEVLTAVFYPPKGSQKVIRLHVSIQAESKRKPNANQGWSFLQRRFELTPQNDEVNLVLNHQSEKVGGGLSSFVVFDQDLPKGNYRIRFTRESGPEGYLTLFKMTEGRDEKRDMFRVKKTY